MTKGELKAILAANQLSDDTEILINVAKYHEGEATWDEISYVDATEHGEPILIGIGDNVMG